LVTSQTNYQLGAKKMTIINNFDLPPAIYYGLERKTAGGVLYHHKKQTLKAILKDFLRILFFSATIFHFSCIPSLLLMSENYSQRKKRMKNYF